MVTTHSNKRGGSKEEEESAKKKARIKADRKRMVALVKEGKLEELQDLLNTIPTENGERAQLINSVHQYGNTILHEAVSAKNIPMIRWILSDEGGRAMGFTNILAATKYCGAALHLAVRDEDDDAFFTIVEGCTVENGERAQLVNALDDSGRTILHEAVESGIVRIIEWILSDDGGRAAGFNKVTARNKRGKTALLASDFGLRAGIFDAFVAGCKPDELTEIINIVEKDGWTLLPWAALCGQSSVVEWLLSKEGVAAGFNKDLLFALTNRNESVLHFAALGGDEDCLETILSSCPTAPDRKRLLLGIDDYGSNIFHFCGKRMKPDNISYFIDNYPEESDLLINRRDNKGMTPLHRVIIGSDEYFDIKGKEMNRVVAALLGYDRNEDDVDEDDDDDDVDDDDDEDDYDDDDNNDYDAVKAVTTRKVIREIAADPNLGLKIQ